MDQLVFEQSLQFQDQCKKILKKNNNVSQTQRTLQSAIIAAMVVAVAMVVSDALLEGSYDYNLRGGGGGMTSS